MSKLIVVALAAFSALAAGLPLAGTAASPPRWHSDYAVARDVARAEGKPLFVTFR